MDYENPKAFTKPEQVTLPPQRRPNTQAMTPHIKMFVSDWYTDEATALLLGLFAHDALGMPIDMIRIDALGAAGLIFAAVAGGSLLRRKR